MPCRLDVPVCIRVCLCMYLSVCVRVYLTVSLHLFAFVGTVPAILQFRTAICDLQSQKQHCDVLVFVIPSPHSSFAVDTHFHSTVGLFILGFTIIASVMEVRHFLNGLNSIKLNLDLIYFAL